MRQYRLYFLNSRTGSIERHQQFEAEDDEAALGRIEAWVGQQPLELWSGGRKIAQVDTALALSGLSSEGLWSSQAPAAEPRSTRLFGFWA